MPRPSTNGLRLLTALPAKSPLKRKREGETARVKKESALPGRVAGANHGGLGAGPRSFELSGSRAVLRLARATPAHCAPPGLASPPKGSDPPHTPQPLHSPENWRVREKAACRFSACSHALWRSVETRVLLSLDVI